jgi:hypothetical protein
MLDAVGGQRHAPAALPPGKTRYPLYRRKGGPQGRSGQVRKISPPPGLDPRTVQPVASRYTDWDILTHVLCEVRFESLGVYEVEPGYNDIGLCDTPSITSDVLWHQLVAYS